MNSFAVDSFKGSFGFTTSGSEMQLDVSTNNADELQSVEQQIMYTEGLDVDLRMEEVFNHMNRAMDFIWAQERVGLSATMYDAFALEGTDQSGASSEKTSVPGFLELIEKAQHLNSILFKTLYQQFKTSGTKSNTPQRSYQRIPDNLILNYFHIEERYVEDEDDNESYDNDAKEWETEEQETVRVNFVRSLVSYLLGIYLFSIFGVGAENTILCPSGHIFLRYPTQLLDLEAHHLGHDEATAAATIKEKNKVTRQKEAMGLYGRDREAMFFLPCFAQILEGRNDAYRKLFEKLLAQGFLALRQHSTFLLTSVTNIVSSILPITPNDSVSSAHTNERVRAAVSILRSNLMMDITDKEAIAKLMAIINRGLSIDYQVNVTF